MQIKSENSILQMDKNELKSEIMRLRQICSYERFKYRQIDEILKKIDSKHKHYLNFEIKKHRNKLKRKEQEFFNELFY